MSAPTVLIQWYRKGKVETLTYIGVCCREWILHVGVPLAPCGLCGEIPTYLRPDAQPEGENTAT